MRVWWKCGCEDPKTNQSLTFIPTVVRHLVACLTEQDHFSPRFSRHSCSPDLPRSHFSAPHPTHLFLQPLFCFSRYEHATHVPAGWYARWRFGRGPGRCRHFRDYSHIVSCAAQDAQARPRRRAHGSYGTDAGRVHRRLLDQRGGRVRHAAVRYRSQRRGGRPSVPDKNAGHAQAGINLTLTHRTTTAKNSKKNNSRDQQNRTGRSGAEPGDL